jgi:hypothetical protein
MHSGCRLAKGSEYKVKRYKVQDDILEEEIAI